LFCSISSTTGDRRTDQPNERGMPLQFSDAQIEVLMQTAARLPRSKRAAFLERLAAAWERIDPDARDAERPETPELRRAG
jgi:hypothetical protein